MMKARPILFSGAMVRALLAGSKTQTRRVVKLAIPDDADEVFFWSGDALRASGHRNVAESGLWARKNGRDGYLRFIGACPYGVPGDLLWVKERLARSPDMWTYVADGSEVTWPARQHLAGKRLDYAPSIHMPKDASRLTLDLTEVRVERLQDISEADALAEGIERIRFPEVGEWGWPQRKYRELWDSINAKKAPWASNPWVWPVSFKVHRQNVDSLLSERGAA